MSTNNVLGIARRRAEQLKGVTLNQTVIDLHDVNAFEKMGPDGRVIKNALVGKLTQTLEMSRLGAAAADNISFEHFVQSSVKFDITVS